MFRYSLIASLFLSLFITLPGCIPVAFVAGAAVASVGGVIVYDRRDTQTIMLDNTISKKIKYTLDHDLALSGSRIKFAIFDQVVLLTGQVSNEALKQRVYQKVMNISGVKRVYNQIDIKDPISLIQQSDDAVITSTIKSTMVATKDLHSTQIRVITEDHVVYLMGIVTRKQAALAAHVASHVKGVAKVVELFEYEE